MGIGPTDSVHLPPTGELIRRVERDSETRDFGQRERPSQEDHPRRSEGDEPEERDTVEVSAQSLAALHGEDEEALSPDAEARPAETPSLERHLDIQA